ncbi:hypothetical protein [Nesterenkonia sp. K-15-9-6]|uniref:hypothetical protein n=1 Tax=Nesterenkonia sp. K-15-9-6 TaxID=3093918 RepID=UPI004043F1A4
MALIRTKQALVGVLGIGALALASCAVADDSEGETEENGAAQEETDGQDAPDGGSGDDDGADTSEDGADDGAEDAADDGAEEEPEEDQAADEHLDGELSGDRVDPDAFEVPLDEQSQAIGARAWQFETPSGRHTCSLGRSGQAATPAAVCYMSFDEDVQPEPDDQGRERHPSLLESDVGLYGYEGPVYPQFESSEVPTLNYGEVLEVEGLACTVGEDAITCIAGDNWMQVSRSGYEFSDDSEESGGEDTGAEDTGAEDDGADA